MLRLGLTGGIASGKSTVSAMLRKLDFPVFEADSIAHQLTEPGTPAYHEIVGEFGESILTTDKKIDRPALAQIVFADPNKLQRLNAIVHPRVGERLDSEFAELQRTAEKYGAAAKSPAAAFVEAALIYEAGMDKKLDGVVVVWCTPEQQIERLIVRGLSEEEAHRRIAAQLPMEEKLQRATEKIDCSGTLEATRHQVEELATKIRVARPML
jgi:dephospho-CoA kinase